MALNGKNKTRPVIFKLLDSVIFKLLDSRAKTKIFKNCTKLKGSNISVSEDFSLRVRNVRKQLWDSCRSNRENKDKVQLIFDKIKINDEVFVWDEESGDKVPMNRKKVSSAKNGNSPSSQSN